MESVKARRQHEIILVYSGMYADSYGGIGDGNKLYRLETSTRACQRPSFLCYL